MPTDDTAREYVDIVFDGPPSAESGRFVEVEDQTGAAISFGEWVHRPDGYWALRITSPAILPNETSPDSSGYEVKLARPMRLIGGA